MQSHDSNELFSVQFIIKPAKSLGGEAIKNNRIQLWILLVVFCLGIGACSTVTQTALPKVTAPSSADLQGADVFTIQEGEIAQFAQAYENDPPISLKFEVTTIAGPKSTEITDAAEIRSFFAALQELRLTGEPGLFMTDTGATFIFKMKDGKQHTIRFIGASLEVPSETQNEAGKLYLVSGFEKLNELTAPLMEKLQSL